MEVHIEVGSRQILYSCEALTVLVALGYLLHQSLRHHLACLVVFRIDLQDFRLQNPVFHDLGWQFDKVSGNTRYTVVVSILEEVM